MIEEFIKNKNLPAYKAKQFYDLYYQKGIESFDELMTWSKELRKELKETIEFSRLEATTKEISRNKSTVKVLFTLNREPSKRIETVLMRHKDGRNTVCVSCMVGCPVNCSFCATGKMGFQGNLTADEIIDQVMFFQRFLKPENQRVSNVVFMGMGEPMLNLKEVEKAVKILIDPDKLGISQRRVTVSTSGYVPQFKQFISDGFRTKIAISLHAPNQELRAKLMPVARQFPLDMLMESLDEYVKLMNKRISYEYIMLKGVNDTREHLDDLIKLLKGRLAHVNLIPYNTIREADFQRTSRENVELFAKRLEKAGIDCTIRVTMGDDINAACGQLADRENEKYKERLNKLKAIIYK